MATIVDMTEYRTVTDVKTHLNEIVESLQRDGERVIVTRHGTPAALIMSWDEWEGLLETIDILRTPGALEEISEGHRGYLAGEYSGLEEVEAVLRARRAGSPRD